MGLSREGIGNLRWGRFSHRGQAGTVFEIAEKGKISTGGTLSRNWVVDDETTSVKPGPKTLYLVIKNLEIENNKIKLIMRNPVSNTQPHLFYPLGALAGNLPNPGYCIEAGRVYHFDGHENDVTIPN
ncbi:hypothetical protein O181_062309 [Austropuccinia psidii MF-1]|uniref:Uncharacterized protein n=1 Tax=Austropuccinia psidii MF-1 TaxID=1389203 RepID=A0A9Q3I1F8_9BASI|nr:hypothetical protein [Austropuccinia psidii MF-1]